MTTIFSVQDETGTVTQLTLSPSPSLVISVGDTGIYEGLPDDGTATFQTPVFQSLPFSVSQVLDSQHFSISTVNANGADWPAGGTITWTTGDNTGQTSVVIDIDPANAYISVADFNKYHVSRGNTTGNQSSVDIRAAIVKATDYLDQKYRYSGIKLLQSFGDANNAFGNARGSFLVSWLTPYALDTISFNTMSTSKQGTEWPRQGVTDFNGDTVNGIPKQIKAACSELALRVLNGTNLQPDYDPGLVGAGGVVSSITKKVGPLETVTSYDTKVGLGFFASFPQIDRMLNRAGLLSSSGGRTVIR
jgi:hypothetical protein